MQKLIVNQIPVEVQGIKRRLRMHNIPRKPKKKCQKYVIKLEKKKKQGRVNTKQI